MTKIIKQISYPLLFLLILVPSKGWIDLNLFQANILIVFVITLNLIYLRTPLIQYFKNLNARKFIDIDVVIFASIIFHFMVSQSINVFALSFLIIYFLSRLIWMQFRMPEEKIKIINAIMIFGFFLLFSVFLGFIEILSLKTNVFSSISVANYPNPIAKLFNHSKGFYYSYNATAYSLAFFYCSISFLLISYKYKRFLEGMTLIMLFLTQAKFAYLFIASIVLVNLLNRSNGRSFLILLGIAIILYIVFSHISVGLGNSLQLDDKYYYLTIFKNENFSVYLSLFSELKHKSFDFLLSIDLLRPNLNNLIIFLNHSEPHNLFISAYFFGGIIFLIALIFLILNALKKSIYAIKDKGFIEMNFFILFMLLVVESLLWDSYDSLIFLLMLAFTNSYPYQTKSANQIKDSHL